MRSSAVTWGAPAEEQAAGMELPRAAQLLAERSHPETGTSVLVTMYMGPELETEADCPP